MISRVASQLIRQYVPRCSYGIWKDIPLGPADPVLGVGEAFKKDTDKRKVNLGIGAYRCDDGKPVLLDSVRRAQKIIVDSGMDNEYLPVQGSDKYLQCALKLGYGEKIFREKGKLMAACQVLSGTGGLRLGLEFAKRFVPKDTKVYCPDPTWPNHMNIARDAGFEWSTYKYYDAKSKGVAFGELKANLEKIPNGQIILFHACAHNPTGCDITTPQWQELIEVVKKKNHLPLLDMAYQGFTSGDTDKDAEAVRLFASQGVPMILVQSFAKNMGLYGQRIGCLSFLFDNTKTVEAANSQLKIVARPIWSSPPLHGARIAETILSSPELNQLWLKEVKMMAERIALMRKSLVSNLKQLGSPHNWDHIFIQQGMFAYTGLKPQHCESLVKDHHIYLLKSGRISVAGVNSKNVKYIAQCFDKVTRNDKI